MKKHLKKTALLSIVAVVVTGLLVSGFYEAQAQIEGVDCQLLAQPGRTLVFFSNQFILGHQSLAQATNGPVTIAIPAGTYRVTLMSYDDHLNKLGQIQLNEQYFLLLSNGQQTNSISDLPQAIETLVEAVDNALTVTGDLTSVTARHTRYFEPGEPNSIIPVCAAFDEIAPSPTPTPTITPAPGGTGGVDDEPDCCPGPDEVTTTPTPKPVPRVQGITTATPTPTPTPRVASLRRLPSAGLPATELIFPLMVLVALILTGRSAYQGKNSR